MTFLSARLELMGVPASGGMEGRPLELINRGYAELRLNGVLGTSGVMALWSIFTPLKQEYTAFVAWPSRRCEKALDRYLPSSWTTARYLQATKKPELENRVCT